MKSLGEVRDAFGEMSEQWQCDYCAFKTNNEWIMKDHEKEEHKK